MVQRRDYPLNLKTCPCGDWSFFLCSLMGLIRVHIYFRACRGGKSQLKTNPIVVGQPRASGYPRALPTSETRHLRLSKTRRSFVPSWVQYVPPWQALVPVTHPDTNSEHRCRKPFKIPLTAAIHHLRSSPSLVSKGSTISIRSPHFTLPLQRITILRDMVLDCSSRSLGLGILRIIYPAQKSIQFLYPIPFINMVDVSGFYCANSAAKRWDTF